ncbi:hypothetical protein [Tumebacillus avium]|uniref:hypothetical protein n=1 Tax=Tumebacillus avium TaxID=1903704 RepID=UPI0012FD00E0|nr:hypothetical protein [Tumebacillus avium]
MNRPSEPSYEAKGDLAKRILEDIKTPATKEELEVIRKAIASRKKKKRKEE